jgi:hypothetical protein
VREARGSIRKPVVMKKIGMKSAFPTNSSSFFASFSLTAALSASPERKAPTMSGSWMSCASELATATIPIITAKYAPSSPSNLFRMAAPTRLSPNRMSGTNAAISTNSRARLETENPR